MVWKNKKSGNGDGQHKEGQEEEKEEEIEGGNGGEEETQEQEKECPREPPQGEVQETEEEHHPNWRRKLTYIGYNEEYPKTNDEHLKFFQQEKKCLAAKAKDLVTKKPQYTRRMRHLAMTHTPQNM